MRLSKEEIERRQELLKQGLKVCSVCHQTLNVEMFYVDKSSRDGLTRCCKDCTKKRLKDKYNENRDKILQRQREYFQQNKGEIMERRKEYIQKYISEHKEDLAEYHRRWYQENKDRILEQQRQTYYECREERLKHIKEYRKTEAGKINSRKIYHKYRALKMDAEGKYTKTDVCELLTFFDGKCAYTGTPLEESFHLDHVVALSKGGCNYIYNLVPSNQGPNISKGAKDMEEWFRKQLYFSEERLQRIYDWMSLKQKEIKGEEENESRDIEEITQ